MIYVLEKFVPIKVQYNSSTRKHYCQHCAFLINEHNPGLCQKITLLDKVKRQISECESIRRHTPDYYKIHWMDIHKTLIIVRDELLERENK